MISFNEFQSESTHFHMREFTLISCNVLDAFSGHLIWNDLLHFGNTNLASYKAPKIVYITRDFPRTKNGKILRRAINKEQALRFSNI